MHQRVNVYATACWACMYYVAWPGADDCGPPVGEDNLAQAGADGHVARVAAGARFQVALRALLRAVSDHQVEGAAQPLHGSVPCTESCTGFGGFPAGSKVPCSIRCHHGRGNGECKHVDTCAGSTQAKGRQVRPNANRLVLSQPLLQQATVLGLAPDQSSARRNWHVHVVAMQKARFTVWILR